MTAPTFRVLKGNPSDDEVAALTAVLAQLSADARAKQAGSDAGERNLWGRLDERFDAYGAQDVFNPSAFRNVRYY
ncbi:acyl-CoA carboxylase subunit epsilon [Corynebacterium striatum]|uniref:Acyl-CoA carboxylase subunit epsilon n=1 Tax=Corynebacterium striatum TaxID=43770 RepID=A0AAQ1TU79_CORST|nr:MULTISPECIES: acyl-CoA carboxylase subunit epsilon [Corynebacterium]ATZ06017.1 acyl-CoA carboxylase subunit epsilon [Corynebacterium striatum]ATZ09592.1 acyl-CoA carboxylase subunit epsilon [Corynebacterium striatum]EEI78136.1 hypothetical protein HMPREF0308_1656 [Corynebacterium striatum ATCC 6940]EGT5574871.1 acyl-CoA carboxylase subunit epsilon [Corynebacterium striatum]EGT5590599.1 acyl-CoA carboxylase subunit epsilon [Corynebacterium striatum]